MCNEYFHYTVLYNLKYVFACAGICSCMHSDNEINRLSCDLHTFSSRGGAVEVVEGTYPCSVQTHESVITPKIANQIIPCVFP